MTRRAVKQLGFVFTFTLSFILSESATAQAPRRTCTQPLQELIERLNEIGVSRSERWAGENEANKGGGIESNHQQLIGTINHIIDVKTQKQQLNYTIQLYYLLRKYKRRLELNDGMTELRFETAFLNIDEAAQCMLEKL